RAQVYEGGAIVVSYLLRTDFTEVGAAEPYSEGIIDYLRAVEGAEMAVLIREPPRRDGEGPTRRVSLRSSVDELDVSAIARRSGGGGRRRAAGLLVSWPGRATQLLPSFAARDTPHLTHVALTARTSTGDPEGDVLEELEPPSQDELERRLAGLRGEIELPIPAASAVKIGGERA